MFEQGQQRALTGIQGDKVHVVKHPWLGELTQFGVHKTTAQHNANAGVMGFDGLRHSKRRIHRPRKRHGQQHHLRLMLGKRLQGKLTQCLIHQARRCRQGLGQGLKRGLASRQ